jgi:hypothetical protein
VRGSSTRELQSWRWDFDAHPLSTSEQAAFLAARGQVGLKGALRKTAAFMEAHPFGAVPAAFSPDGRVIDSGTAPEDWREPDGKAGSTGIDSSEQRGRSAADILQTGLLSVYSSSRSH